MMLKVSHVLCAAATLACFAVGAKADEANKLVNLTFSAPVQIPGRVLPAGSYQFKLAIPEGDRRVVQVTSRQDPNNKSANSYDKNLSVLLLTIPDQRAKPSNDPVVMFNERPAGEPPAVKVWFYPGETYGYEFVYPKDQAIKIAKAIHAPVAAIADNTSSDADSLAKAKVTHIDENGRVEDNAASASNAANSAAIASDNAANAAPARSNSGAAASDTIARNDNRPAQSPAQAAVGTSGRRELPRTASPLGLFELMSALSFAGAFGARRLTKAIE